MAYGFAEVAVVGEATGEGNDGKVGAGLNLGDGVGDAEPENVLPECFAGGCLKGVLQRANGQIQVSGELLVGNLYVQVREDEGFQFLLLCWG